MRPGRHRGTTARSARAGAPLAWPLLALLVLAGCAANPGGRQPDGPPETAGQVDLTRYMGDWYEIARLPNGFQDGGSRRCVAATVTYAPRNDGGLEVLNRCRDAGAADAPVVEARGRAYPVEGFGGSRLRLSFAWPFYGDYWVIGIASDYRWAVVGSPDRRSLWILSRAPVMAAGDYMVAVGIARARGFEVSRLAPTPQPEAATSTAAGEGSGRPQTLRLPAFIDRG